MLFSEENYKFMFAALQEAQIAFDEDEVPVGAVVVYNKKIIGRGHNQVERLKDPTAHAEMIAITAATNFIGNWRLEQCNLFVTLEPCIMCTGASILSRLNAIYFSTFDTKFGACGSIYNIAEEQKANHKIKIYHGLYQEESKNLLKNFFTQKKVSIKKTIV